MEYHLHKRIDELGIAAEEFLEDLPTDVSMEEIDADPELKSKFLLYDEAVEYINVIRGELCL